MVLETYTAVMSKFVKTLRFLLLKDQDKLICKQCGDPIMAGEDTLQLYGHFFHTGCFVCNINKWLEEPIVNEEAMERFGVEYCARLI